MAGHRDFKNLRARSARSETAERVKAELRASDDRTVTTLAELRGRLGITQVELAERLDRSQAQVSRTEHASDPLLSTVVQYVDALGGTLELVVRLSDDPSSDLVLDLPAASDALMPSRPAAEPAVDYSVAVAPIIAAHQPIGRVPDLLAALEASLTALRAEPESGDQTDVEPSLVTDSLDDVRDILKRWKDESPRSVGL